MWTWDVVRSGVVVVGRCRVGSYGRGSLREWDVVAVIELDRPLVSMTDPHN